MTEIQENPMRSKTFGYLGINDNLINLQEEDWYGKLKPHDWFKKVREELGHTQESLGKILGYSKSYVCRIEKGRLRLTHYVRMTMFLLHLMYDRGDLTMQLLVSHPRRHKVLLMGRMKIKKT